MKKTIIVGSWDDNIYLYSIDYGRILDTLNGHDDAVSNLKLCGDILVTSSWDSSVKVWKITNNSINKTPIAEFLDHDTEVKSVDIDRTATLIASGGTDGSIIIYDLKSTSSDTYSSSA